MTDLEIYEAWRRTVAGVTDEEVDALLPLLRASGGRLHELVGAYRLGRRNATELPAPLAGFQPCPNCLSVSVAAIGFTPASAGVARMVARCGDCSTRFEPSNGEPFGGDFPDAPRTVPAEPTDHRGPGG